MQPAAAGGFTTAVTVASMARPLTIYARDVGGPIRSVTISNNTVGTTAQLYAGANANGTPLFTVRPGMFVTLPIMAQSAVSVAFTSSGAFDGAVYVHADPTAMTATGFVLH